MHGLHQRIRLLHGDRVVLSEVERKKHYMAVTVIYSNRTTLRVLLFLGYNCILKITELLMFQLYVLLE